MVSRFLPRTFPVVLRRGFGLIELMVSVSIVVLVLSIVLTRQSAYNSSTLLRNQAFAMALKIREVQLQALTASRAGGSARSVYGLRFEQGNNIYTIFKDADFDHKYDAPGEKFGQVGLVDRRFVLHAINGGGVTELNIAFERPNYDALIMLGSATTPSSDPVELVIALAGNTAKTATIEVTPAGQITVKNN